MLIKDNVLLLHNLLSGNKQTRMKVTLLQTDILWAKPADNQRNAERLISNTPNSDLYILPEMWSTGFATNPIGIAEEEEVSIKSGSIAWMLKTARKLDAAICGSIAIKTIDGTYANRMYFVFPDGTYKHYDKRHLFSIGGEDTHYHAGKDRIVVEFRGVKFMLLICYDLRFPVWSRYAGDYDAIIYVANWPKGRQAVWDTLLKARALENQCYVMGVNRSGRDICCEYNGGSAIISPYGKPLAVCDNNVEVVTAEINIEELKQFRKKFPVLKDRDNINFRNIKK